MNYLEYPAILRCGIFVYLFWQENEIVQHIGCIPLGEVFIEKCNNKWNTPFLFNAKELDEETGLYYYGARYYDPRTSVWINNDCRLDDVWSFIS
ncbi:hypothetical protein G7051_08625 [Dysgonomonas sp. HDW5B]|nr:RHS repeat-associated core domain-containing protein [Dysgonomonas sp. HDW5B]QIK54400.1 hypothetical protein G7051_08625 [Dysgonomonas sp. HDW5B]